MSDELIDTLDEGGNPTGETTTQLEAHTQGLWHRAVHIFVVNSRGEVLIQQRGGSKQIHAGEWDTAHGGHLRAGEDSLAGAIRELREELGLTVEPTRLEFLFELTYQSQHPGRIKREFNPVYLLTIDEPFEAFQFNDREVAAVRWVPLPEFERLASAGQILVRQEEFARALPILHQRWEHHD